MKEVPMYPTNDQARAKVEALYPSITTLDWSNDRARALYDRRRRGEEGRHCPVCHRAFDPRRFRGAHRSVVVEGGEPAVVDPTIARVHGGPKTIYCSESCRRIAMDARVPRAAEWRQCEVCETWFVVWVPTDGCPHKPLPTTCPRPWTPGEGMYARLRSICAREAQEDRAHKLRISGAEEMVAARAAKAAAKAARQAAYNAARRAARAVVHKDEDSVIRQMLEFADALRSTADPIERERIRTIGRPTVQRDPDEWIESTLAHLRHCHACHRDAWAHRHRRAILAASQGKLREWDAGQAARRV